MPAMESAEEKKRIANEKRLKAVQEWQKKKNQQNKTKGVHHSFVSPVKITNIENKPTLFNSDDEDDDNELTLDIRPQFQGQNGQYLLEKSTEYSDRFKLDERFKIDDETPVAAIEESDEKVNNIKILESILGHSVSEKYTEEKNLIKKRNIMRFDPEDENASKYIKSGTTLEEKTKKKIRKEKEVTTEDIKDPIPISTERYIEVNTNLKEILKSASSSQFSLTAKFNFGDSQENTKTSEITNDFSTLEEMPQAKRSKLSEKSHISKKTINTFESKKFTFFFMEDDIRLKEGVGFFQRPKPLEEIRAEWEKNKSEVLELLRKKRKTSQRGYVTKPNASQRNKQFAKNK